MIPDVINIVRAESRGGYRLCLAFDDGAAQTIDFEPFLLAASHPAIRAYLDPVLFASFRVEYGDLVWGDYDLCFPVGDLYLNQIHLPGGEKKAA